MWSYQYRRINNKVPDDQTGRRTKILIIGYLIAAARKEELFGSVWSALSAMIP